MRIMGVCSSSICSSSREHAIALASARRSVSCFAIQRCRRRYAGAADRPIATFAGRQSELAFARKQPTALSGDRASFQKSAIFSSRGDNPSWANLSQLQQSPSPAKTWQHRVQPTAPAAPISTGSGTIRFFPSFQRCCLSRPHMAIDETLCILRYRADARCEGPHVCDRASRSHSWRRCHPCNARRIDLAVTLDRPGCCRCCRRRAAPGDRFASCRARRDPGSSLPSCQDSI
jgi:hypothetical protein